MGDEAIVGSRRVRPQGASAHAVRRSLPGAPAAAALRTARRRGPVRLAGSACGCVGRGLCHGTFETATHHCRPCKMRWHCAKCSSPRCRKFRARTFELFARRHGNRPVLIINGTVTREMPSVPRVTSPVMRAKLCGFHFQMDDGVLEPLEMEEADCNSGCSAVTLPGRGGSVYGSK